MSNLATIFNRMLILIFSLIWSCGTAPNSAAEQAASTIAGGTSTTDGREGPSGPKGDKGDKGDPGSTGTAGTAGTTGAIGTTGMAGPQGIQGAAGAPGHNLNVINSAGTVIGQLWEEQADGSLWVANGNLRFDFLDQFPSWPFPNAFLVYSGAGCAGTVRLVLSNGEFGNVFVDGRDNVTLWAATGNDLGAFNYQSRVAATNSCTTISSSVTRSWATSTPSLPFAYPVTDPQIQN